MVKYKQGKVPLQGKEYFYKESDNEIMGILFFINWSREN